MSNKNNASLTYNEMMKNQKFYTLINTNLNYLLDVYDIVVFNQIVHICNIERGYCSMRFLSKILNMSINRINKSVSKLKNIGMISYKANVYGGTNFFTLNVETIKEIYDNCNNSKIEYRIQYCKELLSKLDNSVSSEDTDIVLEDVIFDTKNDVTVSSEDTEGVSPHDTGVSPHDTGVSPHDTGCVTARYTYKEDITNQYKKNNKNEKYNEDVFFQNFEKREIETINKTIETNDSSSSLNDNSSNELELNEIKIENNNNSNENIFFSYLNETKENCNNDLSSYIIKLNDISSKANREVLMNNSNEDCKVISVNEKEAETGSLECLNEDNNVSNENSSSSLNKTKTKITGANDSSSSSLNDNSNKYISSKANREVLMNNSNEDCKVISVNEKEAETGSLECLNEDNNVSNEEDMLIIELDDDSNENKETDRLINKETTCQSASRETNSFECVAPRPATIVDNFNYKTYLQQQLNKVCDIYDNNNLKWYEKKENMGWVGNVTRRELLKRYTSSEVNVLIAPLFNAIDILIDDIDTNYNTNRIPNYQYN